MRAPTRAREISFTFTPFTPRRVYRPLRSGDGADSEVPRRLCTRQAFVLRRFLRAAAVTAWPQTLIPAPEPMPFAAAANHAASLVPNRLFRSRRASLVVKETALSKSCGSAGARAEGNRRGERAVHIGTTKD